ncbi:hypothetical protein K2173_003197 [Erythroxylum novogranatense]|uniref:Uncharacterized protein n=1 Tax=Erythroxylum novogranatense TaxID=1862640 RepID=A0AAV8SXV2_9ROSI|nr:hypothetical protein K2173_003197 [Erythroxylum novogranatense]
MDYQQQQHPNRYMRPPQPPPPPLPQPAADPLHYHHQRPSLPPPPPPQAPWYSNQFHYHPPPLHLRCNIGRPCLHLLILIPTTSLFLIPPVFLRCRSLILTLRKTISSLLLILSLHLRLRLRLSRKSILLLTLRPIRNGGIQVGASNNPGISLPITMWKIGLLGQERGQLRKKILWRITMCSIKISILNRWSLIIMIFSNSNLMHLAINSFQFQQQHNRHHCVYAQETASFNSGQSSYVSDGHVAYNIGGGISAAAPTTSPSVHQQEVPSSYSSVTGNEETADHNERMYNSSPLPISSFLEGQYPVQSSLPATGRSISPYRTLHRAARALISWLTLNYQHFISGTIKSISPVAPVPSINSWTPVVPTGALYAPIPPGLPSGTQHDPSMAIHSAGPPAPPFGGFPGSSFQPPIPTAGAPYGMGAEATLLPSAFPIDAFGTSNMSERPKKASVPNWLKEEIIKNASVITRTSLEHPKEQTQSVDEEVIDKSIEKVDHADSKSIDSSKSTEEEDDDEDDAEVARTAAINQEIKRVLTEVLLKVTEELFDEIATKVLNEDNLPHESTNNSQAVPSSKASAKILIPIKENESETEDVSEKSSSSAPGNVLGLVNYASDEDDDDEIQSSGIINSRQNDTVEQSSVPKHMYNARGSSELELGSNNRGQKTSDTVLSQTNLIESKKEVKSNVSEMTECAYSGKGFSGTTGADNDLDGGKTLDDINKVESKVTFEGNVPMQSEQHGDNVVAKKSKVDVSFIRDSNMKTDQNIQLENRSHSAKASLKDAEHRSRVDERGDDYHKRLDEKHLRREKADDRNGSRHRKEQDDKNGEKAKQSDSRKRSSHLDVKEDKKEKFQRTSSKVDTSGKREQAKDKGEDRPRPKSTSDLSRHKRQRSSSIDSRGGNSKDNGSNDGSSDDSKRKTYLRRRESSPSPVRSRRRQVSRSPHSKHSQRRHSPYSSLEPSRYVALLSIRLRLS